MIGSPRPDQLVIIKQQDAIRRGHARHSMDANDHFTVITVPPPGWESTRNTSPIFLVRVVILAEP
ncbi:MAG: hypothetical protein HP495_17920 [Nitrospira sp.]|nr:hypothetical protein [Nitrospira sp.]